MGPLVLIEKLASSLLSAPGVATLVLWLKRFSLAMGAPLTGRALEPGTLPLTPEEASPIPASPSPWGP